MQLGTYTTPIKTMPVVIMSTKWDIKAPRDTVELDNVNVAGQLSIFDLISD